MPPKSKAAAAAAAAAAAQPVAVEDLFTTLHRHIEAGEFPQAVKVADQGKTSYAAPRSLFPDRNADLILPG
jgi:signal recognition particle subunit SRP72